MNWYIAKLIFKIETNAKSAVQYDEQWRLIQAESEAQALDKATSIGREEDEVIRPDDRDFTAWRFLEVEELTMFNQQSDGAQILSNTVSPDNEKMYLYGIASKAAYLKKTGTGMMV